MGLKPCPWCKSLDINVYAFDRLNQVSEYNKDDGLFAGEDLRAQCSDCGAIGPMGSENMRQLKREWNSRPEPVVSKMESTGGEE